MTLSPTIAADRRDGELENTALRPGFERSRTAAHSLEINPKHGAATGRRKLVGYQLLRMRAGDSDLRMSLSGPTRQFLPANLSQAARSPSRAAGVGGLIDLLPGRASDAFKFVTDLAASVSRIPSLSFSFALQAAKQAARCCSKAFQDHSLSASSRGLVAVIDGHDHGKGKSKCPTKALKDSTR